MKTKDGISGYTTRGEHVRTHRIQSSDGRSADILTLGARLHDLCTSDGTSLVVRHTTLAQVTGDDGAYLNAVVGRCANRLKAGRMSAYEELSDVQLQLNNGENTLHGGVLSWDRRLFGVEDMTESRIVLGMTSVDCDNGFPSKVAVTVTYEFDAMNRLRVELKTENIGNRATITNMTLHTYFDLTGSNASDRNSALEYLVHAPLAERYLVLDGANVPTGEIHAVSGTRRDFTTERRLDGHDVGAGGEFKGYDDFFVVADSEDGEMRDMVTLKGGKWKVTVRSDQPGFQMYTAGGFDGKGEQGFQQYGAVAVEPSLFVDAANHTNFTSTLLHADESRTQVISYEIERRE